MVCSSQWSVFLQQESIHVRLQAPQTQAPKENSNKTQMRSFNLYDPIVEQIVEIFSVPNLLSQKDH